MSLSPANGMTRSFLPIPQRRRSVREPDLDVGKVEPRAVERMDRLVDRLLGDEDEAVRDPVVSRLASLRLAQNHVDDLFRQRLGRLDVDAEADEPPAPRRCGERESLVVRERTDDPGGPNRRA